MTTARIVLASAAVFVVIFLGAMAAIHMALGT